MIGDSVENQSPKGMRLIFACTYDGNTPDDLNYTGREKSGWEIRNKIIRWCKKHGVKDYTIVRNTSYVRDLHGPAVYELYTL